MSKTNLGPVEKLVEQKAKDQVKAELTQLYDFLSNKPLLRKIIMNFKCPIPYKKLDGRTLDRDILYPSQYAEEMFSFQNHFYNIYLNDVAKRIVDKLEQLESI